MDRSSLLRMIGDYEMIIGVLQGHLALLKSMAGTQEQMSQQFDMPASPKGEIERMRRDLMAKAEQTRQQAMSRIREAAQDGSGWSAAGAMRASGPWPEEATRVPSPHPWPEEE